MDEDELLARFLPQFLALARSRVDAGLAAAAQREPAALSKSARELHTLAGEAGLLGLTDVVPLARDSEKKAKVLLASRADPDAEALIAALHQLKGVIEAIGATIPPTAGDP